MQTCSLSAQRQSSRGVIEMSEGRMYWSTTVIDSKTGEKFKLKTNGDRLRVYPVDDKFNLGTFCRFYEFVVENIDPHAKPVVKS